MTNRFRIEPNGPFSLDASRRFLGGFTPGEGGSVEDGDSLVLAFRLDSTFEPVAVALRQADDGTLHGVASAHAPAASRQAARMLSLDHDARGWVALGKADPVIGRLQADDPGFRPVCFASPYEAAVWAVIVQRLPMARAAAIKRAMSREIGTRVEVRGRTLDVIPGPATLAALEGFPGLAAVKVERLRALGRAALEGRLDPERLVKLGEEEAIERLRELPGIGAWSAQHVWMRGLGLADCVPTAEPRVLEGVRIAYGKKRAPTAEEYVALAERWKPFRMWASVALARLAFANERRNRPRHCGVAA